ncbi:MAG: tetratricopeptide repeat protein [Crocinitomicaceae bacterium]|nr:tetratricopeptide repeat protein [Crocinitomicaceae bacterium]
MKKNLNILFLLLSAINVSAQLSSQQEAAIDSLTKVIATANHDTTVINAWQEWSFIIYVNAPNLDFELIQKIDSLCSVNLKRNPNERERAKFLRAKSDALNSFGIWYKRLGDYAKAINYFTKSLKIYEEIGFKNGIADIFNNIGGIYSNRGDYAKAIDYYKKSLKIYEEIGVGKIEVAIMNIGRCFADQGEYAKAVNYYTKSLNIAKEIGDKNSIAFNLYSIGEIHSYQGEYAKAIDYFTKCLKIKEEVGGKMGIAYALNSIGDSFYNQGDYAKAIDNSSRSLAIAQELGVAIATKEAASSLWKVNKKLGKYKKALEMYELYVTTKDTLESKENEREVVRQEYKYAYEKQAATDSVKAAELYKIQAIQIAANKAEAKVQKQQKTYLYIGLGLLALFGGFMSNRFRVTRKQKNIIDQQKTAVENQKEELQYTHKKLAEHLHEISDSIIYAKRIQDAIMPSMPAIKKALKDCFVLYLPKDVVAGDFFWMEQVDDVIYYAAADCTGHGVPGAMVSVVCSNSLNKALLEEGIREPGKLLDRVREIVVERLTKSGEDVKDGMDISLCALNFRTQKLQWAGANNPIWILRKGATQIEDIKPNKQPIGLYHASTPFTTHQLEVNESDSIYVFTDGYQDQFGGSKGKKFKANQLKEIILENSKLSMNDQLLLLKTTFLQWKGELEQLDDVCMIGVRI